MGWRGEYLKFVTCLQIPLFQKIDLLLIFVDVESGRVICWPVFVDVVNLKDSNNIQKISLESKCVRYSQNFNLIIRHTVT